MKWHDETTKTELDLVRAALVRNERDMGMTVAAIIVLLAVVVMAIVYVVSNR